MIILSLDQIEAKHQSEPVTESKIPVEKMMIIGINKCLAEFFTQIVVYSTLNK